MHSCTKGTHTAGSHHTANYRSKDTTLIPTEVSGPSPMTPTPTNDNKLYIWKPDDLQLPLSLPRQCCIVYYPEKRGGDRRGRGDFYQSTQSFLSRAITTIWLKHPK